MAPTRRGFLGTATAATVAALAGCSTGGGTTTTTATTTEGTTMGGETTTGGTTQGTTMAGSATVQVYSHDSLGDILVDAEGMTLYMFESDTKGTGASTCSGSCAGAWPPLVASDPTAGQGVTADLTTFERGDGDTQVAANGWPLYGYAGDENPGDANGQGVDGFGAEWYVLGPDGTPKEGNEMTTTTTSGGGGATTTTSSGGGGYGGGDY